jgi:Na+-translocating ferredoxin:NAD+ oxidoreductase RnfA subunit
MYVPCSWSSSVKVVAAGSKAALHINRPVTSIVDSYDSYRSTILIFALVREKINQYIVPDTSQGFSLILSKLKLMLRRFYESKKVLNYFTFRHLVGMSFQGSYTY